VFSLVLLAVVAISFGVTTGQSAASSLGMVAAANPYAAEVGAQILEMGGNAVDAAIAVSFALGVVEPYASGLGGEGYAVITMSNGEKYAVDFKSVAPGLATYDKLTEDGYRISTANYTPKGTCVPGVVAGIQKIYDLGATLPLETLMEPAIKLAREGFVVNETFAQTLSDGYEKLLGNGFDFLNEGLAWEEGQVHKNEALAQTLESLAKNGLDDFYTGELADRIDAFMQENEGYLRKSDLENYRALAMEPLHGTYRGYDVIVPHAPVSGPQLLAILNVLEHFNLSAMGWDDPLAVHIIQQVLVLEDVDRRSFISDPAFYDLPTEGFASKEYAKTRFMKIDLTQAIDPDTYFDHVGNPYPFEEGATYEQVMLQEVAQQSLVQEDLYESPSTTHFSVVDRYGNAVAWTQTLSSFWGTSVYMDGFFFNNEMGNYASSYRDWDIINLTPGMKPRTTICPTIIQKDGEVRWVLGTPGGGRIISTITQLIVDLVDFGMPLDQAVKAPKFVGYSSYKDLRMEAGFPEDTVAFLQDVLGHDVNMYGYPDLFFGGPNIIAVEEDGMIIGAGSIRRNGAASAPEK